jgi:hypothetical protein
MKKMTKKHKKALIALWAFFLIFTISIYEMKAQDFSHEGNIKLPSTNNSGFPVGDIIAADGKLFLYSSEGIVYFNPSESPIVFGFVDFDVQLEKHFGKFNPVISGSGGNDANMMTFNEADHLLYVVTPDLKIMKISTQNPNLNSEIVMGTPGDISHFQTLHGYTVLKFDPYHNRLFWLIEGRNEENETGQFHYRDTYLVVYKVNEDGNELTYINSMLAIGHDEGQYMETIYDVEFNEINDYFYVAKKRHLEVWQIEELTHTFILVDSFETLAGKFGKLLYLHNNQIHKILAFPFRLPFTGIGFEYEPPMATEITFYCIDGDDPHQIDEVLSPSKRINDAVFLTGNNDLFLCYSPDGYIQDYVVPANSDVAYYHFDGNHFQHNYEWTLNTNAFPQYNEPEQLMNRPLHLFANTPFSIILGKTHEIVRISKPGSSYTFNQIYSGESNCFSKTAKILPKDYILDPTLNGLAVYDENQPNEDLTFIRTAYPVYNICANPMNGNLYFSNRLSSENCGFYIYNPATGVASHINQYSPNSFSQPIGDLIFNQFTGQYLVSENAPDEIDNHVNVKVFNGESNLLVENIDVPGQYAKEMFISPQGWLYILYDMHEGLDPKILVLNANDYSGNTNIDLVLPGYIDPFLYYTADFLYNPVESATYITISPNAINLEPYNSVTNSMREYSVGIHGHNGLFIKMVADQVVNTFQMHFPGKMICPDAESTELSANYAGKIFIKTNSLAIYQYNNPDDPATIPGNPQYNEIIYSAFYDTVYGLRDEHDEQTGFPNDREINIYKIFADGTSEWKFHYPGQAAAFFDNPYDTMLYLFVKIDDKKLGDTPASLLQLSPKIPGLYNDIEDVDNTDFYIDYDHNGDYGFHFYNMINPYIDRYSDQIYLPNGGHGNVSVVSFKTEEPYYLGSGIKWLSFPRLIRPDDEVEPSPEVLDRIKVPPNYDRGQMSNLVPNTTNLRFIEYLSLDQEWDFSEGQLSTVHSSLGYKIDYLEPQAQRHIIMEGEVWSPNESVTVFPRYENWVGYWLPETQSPFEAIPQNVLDQLISIKAQNWTCGKYWGGLGDGGGEPGPSYWLCACHKGRIALNYGDMVILKTIATTGPSSIFQWQRFGSPPDKEPKPETEYFTYTEKSDYIAYFIEMDTTGLPQEIAAYVNDTCVGATKVLPGDTLVLVPGYTTGMDGEVTFEQYFGPLKSQRITNREYLVYNKVSSRKERRVLHSKDDQDYYTISFKIDRSRDLEIKEEAWIKCMPNPVAESFDIRYYIPASGEIDISLFDLFGRKVSTILHGFSVEGEYLNRNGLPRTNGQRLHAGVYYLILKTDAYKAETKVILID